jgi:hypothetical protein
VQCFLKISSPGIPANFPNPNILRAMANAIPLLMLFPFDRITPLGYNCDPSLKTPAEKPLLGVLITFIRSK